MAIRKKTATSAGPTQSLSLEGSATPSITNLNSSGSLIESTHEAVQEGGFHHHPTLGSKIITITTDVCTLVLGLGYFIFVCLVASYHGRPIDFRYSQFQAILTTIAPLFPMVFAFIVGRLFYHAARRRLEIGSSLGTLEQLIGSQTVGGAVATQFKLAAFNPLGVFILAIWALSPLGGQSLLRILQQDTPPEKTSFIYLNIQEADPVGINHGQMNASYIKVLSSDGNIRTGPADPWGHIKIPVLAPEASNNTESWHQLSDEEKQSYSALFGIPIADLTPGNSVLSVETSYLHLECEPTKTYSDERLELSTVEKSLNRTALNEVAYRERSEFRNYTEVITNGSWYGYQPSVFSTNGYRWNIALDRFIDRYWLSIKDSSLSIFTKEAGIESGPTSLLFQFEYRSKQDSRTRGSGRPPTYRFTSGQCHVLQKYVETRLSCSSNSQRLRPDCNVVAQRPSLRIHPPESLSFISDPQVFAAISRIFTYIPGIGEETLRFLFNPDDPDGFENPISATNLSLRLGQAINTFFLVHQISNFLDPLQIPSQQENDRLQFTPWTTSNATTVDVYYVYSITWPWMVVSLTSCLVLSLASIIGVGFVHIGKGPEVLGYVSSAIRDTKFPGVPLYAGQMDGDKLSKIMKKGRFRYGYRNAENGRRTLEFGPEEDISVL